MGARTRHKEEGKKMLDYEKKNLFKPRFNGRIQSVLIAGTFDHGPSPLIQMLRLVVRQSRTSLNATPM